MTGAEIMYAVSFIVGLISAMSAIWWRIEGKVKEGRDEAAKKADAAVNLAALARAELAAYQTRAAETFATKDGMQRQTDQLLRAIESVASRIDGLNERLDRAFEARPTRRSS